MDALSSIVDPSALRWIWLTHEDRDHTGSLRRLLDVAPRARLLTTFMALGRIMSEGPVPLDRVRLVNPGDTVNIGDRNLRAVRPPLFDSPATVGFLDDRTGALFSSDCYGAPMPDDAMTTSTSADELPATILAEMQTAWALVDSAWVTMADQAVLARAFDHDLRLEPEVVLSSHLPPIRDSLPRISETLRAVPSADPVPGLTQAELEVLLAGFEPVEASTERREDTHA